MFKRIINFFNSMTKCGICNKCELDAPGCWEFEENCPLKVIDKKGDDIMGKELSVITEQGDLGLGITPISESEKEQIKDKEKKDK